MNKIYNVIQKLVINLFIKYISWKNKQYQFKLYCMFDSNDNKMSVLIPTTIFLVYIGLRGVQGKQY